MAAFSSRRRGRAGAWFASVAALAVAAAACGGTQGGEGAGDGGPAGEPIKLGFISIFSGRVAMLGDTGFKGAQMAVELINDQGGVLGRPLEISSKDTAADPAQAVRAARELVLREDADFIIDGSSSNESFAVSQASGQLGTVVVATASEADSLTAPKNFQELEFRSARSTRQDAIAAALYVSSELSDKKTWASISPDYAYGRDCTDRFFEYLEEQTEVENIGPQLWPALFEPDYTPLIQRLVQAEPDAVYSCLWGGDLVAFIQQARPFGLFEQTTFVTPNLADSLVLDQLTNLPAGIHTSSRFAPGAPDTPENKAFAENYRGKFGEGPTNWSAQAFIGVNMLKSAIEKAGSTDPQEVAAALEGLQLEGTPWGDVRMRAEDHTLVEYAIHWGVSNPTGDEYPIEFSFETDWDTLLKLEGVA